MKSIALLISTVVKVILDTTKSNISIEQLTNDIQDNKKLLINLSSTFIVYDTTFDDSTNRSN